MLNCMQTFSQLCTFDYGSKTVQIFKAPWYIRDKPRFAYRGLLLGKFPVYWKLEEATVQLWARPYIYWCSSICGLLADTSRHYLPVDIIKQVIDSMSYAKLVCLYHINICLFIIEIHEFLAMNFEFYSNLNWIILILEFHSVECSSLAHHRRGVFPSRNTSLSIFVEWCILNLGAVHNWGCSRNC